MHSLCCGLNLDFPFKFSRMCLLQLHLPAGSLFFITNNDQKYNVAEANSESESSKAAVGEISRQSACKKGCEVDC